VNFGKTRINHLSIQGEQGGHGSKGGESGHVLGQALRKVKEKSRGEKENHKFTKGRQGGTAHRRNRGFWVAHFTHAHEKEKGRRGGGGKVGEGGHLGPGRLLERA